MTTSSTKKPTGGNGKNGNGKRIGRPPSLTPEVASEICTRLMLDESLRSITKDSHIPSITTVMNWLQAGNNGDERYTSFLEQYSRARAVQPDVALEKMIDIEDKTIKGEIDANAARVAIGSIQWRMGKMNPKKYGDTRQIDINQNVTLTVEDNRKRIVMLVQANPGLLDEMQDKIRSAGMIELVQDETGTYETQSGTDEESEDTQSDATK